jgi:hypothetical protein
MSLISLPCSSKGLVGVANIGFRLRHRRDIEEHQRLPQMMVRAEAPDGTRRDADYRACLAALGVHSIGPRADIDVICQANFFLVDIVVTGLSKNRSTFLPGPV